MNPDLIIWEIEYFNGRILRESDGIPYGKIPRDGVSTLGLFSLEFGQPLVSFDVGGRTNFFYRRRTRMIQGGPARVAFLLGLYPYFGLRLDTATGQVDEVEPDIVPQPWENSSFEG